VFVARFRGNSDVELATRFELSGDRVGGVDDGGAAVRGLGEGRG